MLVGTTKCFKFALILLSLTADSQLVKKKGEESAILDFNFLTVLRCVFVVVYENRYSKFPEGGGRKGVSATRATWVLGRRDRAGSARRPV